MDTDKIKIYGARVRSDSMTKVAEIEAAEKEKMKAKCHAIAAHGISAFINRQLIYNFPEEIFADLGICAIEHADFVGIERLALVLVGTPPERPKVCDLLPGGFLEHQALPSITCQLF